MAVEFEDDLGLMVLGRDSNFRIVYDEKVTRILEQQAAKPSRDREEVRPK
jgi:hypothetical protein